LSVRAGGLERQHQQFSSTGETISGGVVAPGTYRFVIPNLNALLNPVFVSSTSNGTVCQTSSTED
jgi:hypothetical protein